MQNVLKIIDSIKNLNLNARSYHEIGDGIQVSLRVGYDGLVINANTIHAPQKLALTYSIDTSSFDDNGECKLALRSIETGCKLHITKTSRVQTPTNAIKTITDTNKVMEILSNFIKVIDRKLSFVEDSISTVFDRHTAKTCHNQG